MSAQVLVGIEDVNGSWRVSIRKGPGAPPYAHPQLLTTEADAIATEIRNAANECRRRNAPPARKWP